MQYTSLRITTDLRDALKARGRKGESYEDIIRTAFGIPAAKVAKEEATTVTNKPTSVSVEPVNVAVTAEQPLKTCTHCHVAKPLGAFGKDKSTKTGLRYDCRECVLERSRKGRAKKGVVATEAKPFDMSALIAAIPSQSSDALSVKEIAKNIGGVEITVRQKLNKLASEGKIQIIKSFNTNNQPMMKYYAP